jgi:hypothetical protein
VAKVRKWPVPQPGSWSDVIPLLRAYHPYGSGGSAGSVWVAREGGRVVAAWTWQPPPLGSAKAVSPACPSAVLSLSRMVAIPKSERDWHLSKPLKWLMKNGLDRGRWPGLVTYADTGEGHTGHVYLCSGWQPDGEHWSKRYERADEPGIRRSVYANGRTSKDGLVMVGRSKIIRFVHRVCEPGLEREHIESNGWSLVETGKRWKSGNPARKWVRRPR